MEHNIIIINSLKYIDKHINEPITAKDIADKTGYSLYYFSRIFKKQIGLSIMDYVKQRRLIKSSEEIVRGKKIIDIALEYGYQSHSSFTKAFKNKFGFSPSLLRAFHFQMSYLGGNYNMSHIFIQNTHIHATKEELFEILTSTINKNMLGYDQRNIIKAYKFACTAHTGEKRYSGDDYVTHSINVAIILSEIGSSEEAIIAALLHDIIFEKSNISSKEIITEFSSKIAKIIFDTRNISTIESIEDEDVIMLKLADRLHNMRTIEYIDKTRWKEKAKETLDIFSPVAVKFNNEKLTAELNDLSLKYSL